MAALLLKDKSERLFVHDSRMTGPGQEADADGSDDAINIAKLDPATANAIMAVHAIKQGLAHHFVATLNPKPYSS